MEKTNRTVQSDDALDARTDELSTKTWVIGSNENRCEHPDDDLRHVGDDGRNVYYRCELCEAMLISEIELLVR
jgi:hypothetical protein